MKFGTPVKQSQPFNRGYFHANWCPICDFMGFWIFWKKNVVSLTFVKFELSSQNCTQIYYIDQGTLVLNLAKIDWSIQIFWKFSQNYLTQENFDLSSWNFVHKCTNTEWCLILKGLGGYVCKSCPCSYPVDINTIDGDPCDMKSLQRRNSNIHFWGSYGGGK